MPKVVAHGTQVEYRSYHYGYPFRATCWCGWKSKHYADTHAAQMVADAHMADPTRRNLTVLI